MCDIASAQSRKPSRFIFNISSEVWDFLSMWLNIETPLLYSAKNSLWWYILQHSLCLVPVFLLLCPAPNDPNLPILWSLECEWNGLEKTYLCDLSLIHVTLPPCHISFYPPKLWGKVALCLTFFRVWAEKLLQNAGRTRADWLGGCDSAQHKASQKSQHRRLSSVLPWQVLQGDLTISRVFWTPSFSHQ